ncbi:MAG: AMP-binding protein [Firmicutes bacterium]|nr:AMP-binding protein [Bacillota bacterium]MCL1954130.1 AMP-binding protein [Bacillota bacterium]
MPKLLNITIGQLLDQASDKYGTVQAVKYIECDYERTYYEINKDADAIAKGLLGLGFKKGDHICVWATNYPQWLVLFFATAKIGVVLVTANTNYKQDEISYLLKQSDSKAIFISNGIKDLDCQKIMYTICPELKTAKVGKLYNANLPELRAVFSMDDNSYDGFYNWKDIASFGVLVSQSEYVEACNLCSPQDVINIQYTSGTTGFPKGVMLTHYNIVNNAKQIGDRLGFGSKDRLCIPVPFFHVFGIVVAILACVTHGSTMIPLLYYTPLKVMHAVEFEKCTALHGVPTMFINVLSHRDFNKYDFSSLRAGIMAGSPCPRHVMQAVVDNMNMRDISSLYGQTEASPACTQCHGKDSIELKVSTVGCGMEYVENKIVDPITGLDLPDGEQGEFVSRGYHIMKGYYKNPEATAKAIDKNGWLHTGDLAVRDPNGYFRITGRIKDMIIRGGENISPKEIEDILYGFEKVQDAQVVSVPNPKLGEEVCAFVILKDGVQCTKQQVQEYVSTKLARHKVPTYVIFVDKFPLTASGKIQKFKLREQAKIDLGIKDDGTFVMVDIDNS